MTRLALGLGVLVLGCASSSGAGSGSVAGAAGSGAAGASGGAAAASGGATTASGGATTGGTTSASGGNVGTGGATTGGTTSASGGNAGTGGITGTGGVVTAQGCPTSQQAGTWQNVTPSSMSLPDAFHGPITVGVDVVHPNQVWVHAMAEGTWKSDDCGMTWKKVSTGTNGDAQNSGRQWIATIDRNPNRDPNTYPTLYVTQGYGADGIWKSVNGGVDWTDVWNNNIYAEDGSTNIYSDVGRDIGGVFLVDASGPNHLLAYLHSYWGTQGNNGIFESTDGGGKWVVHKAETFNFQPHSDVLFPYDAKTWMVAHGTSIYRTTDGAKTWTVNNTDVTSVNLGRAYIIRGSTIYAGTDYAGGVYKSTDAGATWKDLHAPGNRISWVAATATTLYASNDRDTPHIYQAPLDKDTSWKDDGWPGMVHGGANVPGVIFDGAHYVLVSACEQGGIWRYVEP